MTSYIHPKDQLPSDLQWMDLALAMAQEALDANEVPVGCIFVHNGNVLAAARNRTNEICNATRHAELEAIDHILRNPEYQSFLPTDRPLQDVTLYVTVEPCIMCSSALRQLGIGEVFCGCLNERFGGCGGVLGVNAELAHPALPPYPCKFGYRREECILILRRFYLTENSNAPVPRSKARRILKTDVVRIAESDVRENINKDSGALSS